MVLFLTFCSGTSPQVDAGGAHLIGYFSKVTKPCCCCSVAATDFVAGLDAAAGVAAAVWLLLLLTSSFSLWR